MRLLWIAVLLLHGCTEYVWYAQNKSESDFYVDKHQCELEALQYFPQALVTQIDGGYLLPPMVDCYGHRKYGYEHCVTRFGGYAPSYVYMVDANAKSREMAINSCLNAKGWRLQKKQ
ncbi:MAG: hypothetical protein IT497_05165 [Ottowia sp.]|nr:hypothetical protein [Ottowia sp.]